MCRVFCYIAFMVKGAYIVIGFVLTYVVFYTLAILIKPEGNPYYFIIISSLTCLITGIILIKKGYKNTGIGVISALISFYLFILMLYWMMQGPM